MVNGILKCDDNLRNEIEAQLISELVQDYNSGDTTVFSKLVRSMSTESLYESLSSDNMKKLSERFEKDQETKKTDTINFLESLVHKRMTLPQLNEVLNKFFSEEVHIVNITAERDLTNDPDDNLEDYNLMFNVSNNIYVDGDIYVLETRKVDDNDNIIYFITEVGYEFF